MPEHFKSWSALKKRLEGFLCDSLSGRIEYFLTFYHEVHNSYGRASIRLDKKELMNFSWIEMYHQEWAISKFHENEPSLSFNRIKNALKSQWDANCTYCNYDFIDAVLKFMNLSINDALLSDNYIIKILAVLDRRTGKRTLIRIKESKEYLNYPEWVQLFYKLRFESEKI